MVASCFGCGAPAKYAVEVTFSGLRLGDGFVCSDCSDGRAVEALREEHRALIAHGVPAVLITHMIRQRVEGRRAEA